MRPLNRSPERHRHAWFLQTSVASKPALVRRRVDPPRAQLPWPSAEVGVRGSEDTSSERGVGYDRLLLSTPAFPPERPLVFLVSSHIPSACMLQPQPTPLQDYPHPHDSHQSPPAPLKLSYPPVPARPPSQPEPCPHHLSPELLKQPVNGLCVSSLTSSPCPLVLPNGLSFV